MTLSKPPIKPLPLTCLLEVLQAVDIYREEAHSGPILGAHVGNGGPVSNGELFHSGAEEFHELSHDSQLTEMLK